MEQHVVWDTLWQLHLSKLLARGQCVLRKTYLRSDLSRKVQLCVYVHHCSKQFVHDSSCTSVASSLIESEVLLISVYKINAEMPYSLYMYTRGFDVAIYSCKPTLPSSFALCCMAQAQDRGAKMHDTGRSTCNRCNELKQ